MMSGIGGVRNTQARCERSTAGRESGAVTEGGLAQRTSEAVIDLCAEHKIYPKVEVIHVAGINAVYAPSRLPPLT